VHVLEGGHRVVRGLLHPLAQRLRAVQLPRRVRVEACHRLLRGGAGAVQLGGDRLLLRDDAGEFLPAPLVRLVEVDGGAEEQAGEALVALAAHPVLLRGVRGEFPAQELGEVGVGLAGVAGAALERGGEGVVGRVTVRARPGDEGGEEGGVGVGEVVGLLEDGLHLAQRRHGAAAASLGEGGHVAVHGGGEGGEAGGDGLPVRRRLVGHEVEDVAHLLGRGGDDVQVAEVLAGVVEFEGQPVTLGDRRLRDRVDVVGRLEVRERGQQFALGGRAGLRPGGGEVGQLVVVARQAEAGGADGGAPGG